MQESAYRYHPSSKTQHPSSEQVHDSGMPSYGQPQTIQSQWFTQVDPYVVQALQQVCRKMVVIQTARANLRGVLLEVRPDHVVLDVSGAMYLVRISQIIGYYHVIIVKFDMVQSVLRIKEEDDDKYAST